MPATISGHRSLSRIIHDRGLIQPRKTFTPPVWIFNLCIEMQFSTRSAFTPNPWWTPSLHCCCWCNSASVYDHTITITNPPTNHHNKRFHSWRAAKKNPVRNNELRFGAFFFRRGKTIRKDWWNTKKKSEFHRTLCWGRCYAEYCFFCEMWNFCSHKHCFQKKSFRLCNKTGFHSHKFQDFQNPLCSKVSLRISKLARLDEVTKVTKLLLCWCDARSLLHVVHHVEQPWRNKKKCRLK